MFWLLLRRALLMICEAITARFGTEEPEEPHPEGSRLEGAESPSMDAHS